jgi:hypothetical protein
VALAARGCRRRTAGPHSRLSPRPAPPPQARASLTRARPSPTLAAACHCTWEDPARPASCSPVRGDSSILPVCWHCMQLALRCAVPASPCIATGRRPPPPPPPLCRRPGHLPGGRQLPGGVHRQWQAGGAGVVKRAARAGAAQQWPDGHNGPRHQQDALQRRPLRRLQGPLPAVHAGQRAAGAARQERIDRLGLDLGLPRRHHLLQLPAAGEQAMQQTAAAHAPVPAPLSRTQLPAAAPPPPAPPTRQTPATCRATGSWSSRTPTAL